MADDGSRKNNAISFTFSKKNTSKKAYNAERNVLGSDATTERKDEIDFVHSSEGKELKSVKPEEKVKEKVIPCLSKNRWILPPDAKVVNKLDREAAEELMKAITQGDGEENGDENVAIPMLLKNALPDVEGYEKNEKLDIILRPEQSSLGDYEGMPVSSFGAAMLRGMGWSKGEAIGGTNKGLTEPIEYIPRSKGLGLGAVKRAEEMPDGVGRKRKPGDPTSKDKSGPIKEKDGRVRHFKGLGEKVESEDSLDYKPGTAVLIEKGPHKEMCGKIVAIDVDTSRITVQLHLNKENITLHQYSARLLDDAEYKTLSRQDRAKENSRKQEGEYSTSKRSRDDDSSREKYHNHHKHLRKEKEHDKPSSQDKQRDSYERHEKPVKCWLFPQIRVRIVSKDYKKGKYYNKKVQVVDVVSRDRCVGQTEEGKLLEDIPQWAVETVVPKTQDAHVRVVRGEHRGQLAVLLERDPSKYRAVIQLLLDKHVVSVDYDDICEHTGDINEF